MKNATSAQTPSRMAKATGKDNEARTQRPRSNAMVLHTQDASMVTGHDEDEDKGFLARLRPDFR